TTECDAEPVLRLLRFAKISTRSYFVSIVAVQYSPAPVVCCHQAAKIHPQNRACGMPIPGVEKAGAASLCKRSLGSS
ncbi:MAG: hypothetical protein MJE12_20185, partial [Alphaproteobacteria bacterium]|nr:hypothetical protein [Alphaproteobacteria bacterium]